MGSLYCSTDPSHASLVQLNFGVFDGRVKKCFLILYIYIYIFFFWHFGNVSGSMNQLQRTRSPYVKWPTRAIVPYTIDRVLPVGVIICSPQCSWFINIQNDSCKYQFLQGGYFLVQFWCLHIYMQKIFQSTIHCEDADQNILAVLPVLRSCWQAKKLSSQFAFFLQVTM